MKQMKCPNCGSRTTDAKLALYSGRCIGCRQVSALPTSSEVETSRAEVVETLARIREPTDAESAPRNLGGSQQFQNEALALAGRRNMLFGALWCLGGLFVTVLSYSVASGSGGGRYVIAGGAIVFGAAQFVRGLVQANESKE